jgi:hypothetical protein
MLYVPKGSPASVDPVALFERCPAALAVKTRLMALPF